MVLKTTGGRRPFALLTSFAAEREKLLDTDVTHCNTLLNAIKHFLQDFLKREPLFDM